MKNKNKYNVNGILGQLNTLLKLAENLDNGIGSSTQEREEDMSRVKAKINIDGQTKWISADSIQHLVDDVLAASVKSQAAKTFKKYASEYVELYKANGSVSRNTLIGYKGYLENHLIPFFKDTPISEITPNLIQHYINEKSKKYTIKTITETLNLLRPILDAAVEDGIINHNPCTSQRISVTGKKGNKVLAYSESEFKELESLLNHLTGIPKLFLGLSLYTGLRQGEMFALQWTDVDWENDLISINKSVEWPSQNKGYLKQPKTENGIRVVYIIPQLLGVLREQRKSSGYILTSPRQKTDSPMSHQAVKRLNERVNNAAEKNHVSVRFLSHRARHTVATFMNNAGVDDITITSTIGHSDAAFTKRQYMNKQQEQLKRGMKRYSNYLLSI